MDERTYTQKEVEELAVALKERQETLEALECARIVMMETKQYPRFITRIEYLIRSIEGVQEEEVKPVKTQQLVGPHSGEQKKNQVVTPKK